LACSQETAPQCSLEITPFGLAFYELVIGSKHSELILLKEARRHTNRLALAQG